MRSFAEIMSQEKKNRNILEIKTVKNKSEEAPPPDLKAEDIGELLFDILKVNPADCLAYDYNTGRYDTKQIKLKPGIPVTNILAKSPLDFKGHKVIVTQQRLNITKITFKNVPLNVPDEEIIHLCMAYMGSRWITRCAMKCFTIQRIKVTPDLPDSWTWSWMRASPLTTITGWKVLYRETRADVFSSSTLVKPSNAATVWRIAPSARLQEMENFVRR